MILTLPQFLAVLAIIWVVVFANLYLFHAHRRKRLAGPRGAVHVQPARWRARTVLVLTSTLLPIAGLELGFSIYDDRVQALLEASPCPFYRYSFYATDGKRKLGRSDGPLKLVLDPYVQFRNLPNQSHPWFTINSRGYRGGEVDLRPAVRRVALVGGSTAFGTGVPSDGDTFGARLERKLDNVQVINAAIIGSVSSDALTLVQRELLDLQPSLMIEFDGINDAVGVLIRNGGILQKMSYQDLEEGLLELHSVRTSRAAALLAALRTLLPHIGWRLRAWRQSGTAGQIPEKDLDLRVRLYTQNLLRTAGLAAQRGVPFLVLLQPQRPDRYLAPRGADSSKFPDSDVMRENHRVYTRFVSAAARVLTEHEIPFLNLHESASLRAEHFTDDIHLSPDGAEVVAEQVFQFIKDRDLLRSTPGSPASANCAVTPGGGE